MDTILNIFPKNDHGRKLQDLFQRAYLTNKSLAEATRFLVYHFFAQDGLVVIDGDDVELKKSIIPMIKADIFDQNSYNKITETNDLLKDYHIQINPREINWFYIKDDLRERLVFKNNSFLVNNTKIVFTEAELENEIQNHPERFSPNALLRPLYQEFVLPNLAYVGGAAEVAYWLQLKSTFDFYKIMFPMVMLRDHAVLVNEKQYKKLEKFEVSFEELFLSDIELCQLLTKRYSASNVDFRHLREILEKQFDYFNGLVSTTNKSFDGAVKAEQKRQMKSLDKLEKRFWKAEKMRLQEKIDSVLQIKAELFPRGIMQERVHNFSTYYAEMGEDFVFFLKEHVKGSAENIKIINV